MAGPSTATPAKLQTDNDSLPLYCDFSCPKSDFPPTDAVGACRREQAVWCNVLNAYNNKNARCKVRIQ